MRGKGKQWTSATRSYHQLHLPTFRPASWFHYFNSKAPCILGYRVFHKLVRLVSAYSITFIDYNTSMVIHSNFRFEFILLVTKNEDRLNKEAAWTGSGVGGSVWLAVRIVVAWDNVNSHAQSLWTCGYCDCDASASLYSCHSYDFLYTI